jgi:hypothetical protein
LKLRFMLAVLLFTSGLYAAPTVFNVNGTFADGTHVTGTVTIDTGTGVVTSGALTLSAPNVATLTTIEGASLCGSGTVCFGLFNAHLSMTLVFPVIQDLVGYSGGNLCSTTTSCSADSALYLPPAETADRLTSGSLTPAPPAGTPAPPSLWLAMAGCIAILAYALRARRRTYA